MASYTCMFCGGERKRSKEHGWSDWDKPILGSADNCHTVIRKVIQVDGIETEALSKQVQGGLHSVTINQPCASCNNGWMSELEEASKPTLEALFLEYPVHLTRWHQRVLARYFAMKSMVFSFIGSDPGTTTFEERDELRRGQDPSNLWRIWLATQEELLANREQTQHLIKDRGNDKVAHTEIHFRIHGFLIAVTARSSNHTKYRFFDTQDAIFRSIHPFDGEYHWPPIAAADAGVISHIQERGLNLIA
ncbi:MAG: hypothetical protein JXQ99_16305 [Hyphomicrobiaceae bacterium]